MANILAEIAGTGNQSTVGSYPGTIIQNFLNCGRRVVLRDRWVVCMTRGTHCCACRKLLTAWSARQIRPAFTGQDA